METKVKAVELRELWRRYKQDGDEKARERLVVAYSPLVKFVAGRMASGLPVARRGGRPDLLRAARADRRDRALRPEREIRFETFAVAADQGRDHRRAALARLGAALGPLEGARHRDGAREARGQARRAPSDEEMAEKLEMSVEELQRLAARDRQLLGPRPRRPLDVRRPRGRRGQISVLDTIQDPTPSTPRRRSTPPSSRTGSPTRSSPCPSASASSSPSTTTRTSPCARSARSSGSPSRASPSSTRRPCSGCGRAFSIAAVIGCGRCRTGRRPDPECRPDRAPGQRQDQPLRGAAVRGRSRQPARPGRGRSDPLGLRARRAGAGDVDRRDARLVRLRRPQDQPDRHPRRPQLRRRHARRAARRRRRRGRRQRRHGGRGPHRPALAPGRGRGPGAARLREHARPRARRLLPRARVASRRRSAPTSSRPRSRSAPSTRRAASST